MGLLEQISENNEEFKENEFNYKDFIYKKTDVNDRLQKYLEGSIPRGYRTGIEPLDNIIVCKINELLACVGKKGRGKTTIQQILLLCWAMANDLTFVLALQENDVSLEKMNLLGYIFGENPNDVMRNDKELFTKGVEWLDKHFIFIDVSSFKEATDVVIGLQNDGYKIDGLFCDPVNSFESGFKDTGNSYNDEKHTAKKLLDFAKNNCSVFVSQHPNMSGQRSNEDVNSYSAEGGHFLNKAHFTWSINRDNGSGDNRIGVDNVRNKYTGGDVTSNDNPLKLIWSPYKIDIEHNYDKKYLVSKNIIQKIRKTHNPLKELDTSSLPNWIESKTELPKIEPKDAFNDDIPF